MNNLSFVLKIIVNLQQKQLFGYNFIFISNANFIIEQTSDLAK